MQRPELRKIVFVGYPNQHTYEVVTEAMPHSEVVFATTPEERRRHLPDAQMVIGGGLSDDEIAIADQLVWQHVPWVGVEGTLTPALREKSILLTNGSGVNSANIAEHVIAMMLAFARDIPRFVRDQRRRQWRDWDEQPTYFELGGQTVLCLGTGSIGQDVARRLGAFGCKMIGASRSGRQIDGYDECVPFDALPEVLPSADHVVSSLPMTPGTAGIMSRELIGSMKQGAYFYNVGRGGTVDQEALIDALRSGHLAGAGLDVVAPEPLPEDHPLWDTPNVLITSHTSGNSPQAARRMAMLTLEQLRRYQAGEELLNIVDQTAGY